MLKDSAPTLFSNWTTLYTETQNYFRFYDEADKRYNNYTQNNNTQSFILPWWRQVLLFFLSAGMVVVATVGHLVVVWIVLANKRMRRHKLLSCVHTRTRDID